MDASSGSISEGRFDYFAVRTSGLGKLLHRIIVASVAGINWFAPGKSFVLAVIKTDAIFAQNPAGPRPDPSPRIRFLESDPAPIARILPGGCVPGASWPRFRRPQPARRSAGCA